MDKNIEKLKEDEHYYGEFGKQFLSNSDISTLLNNPKMLHKTKVDTPALVIGGYFHTAILEPGKLKQYKIIESSTRNTKKYKEMSMGEICLLQHEVDKIELMTEAIMDNNICRELIKPMLGGVVYEEPRTGHLFGNTWKGKADIINHEEKLVVDLKTTSDLDRFRWSSSKYNYDSQAYIYSKLFKYEMLFIVIDKQTLQIGMFDCSPQFYQAGESKVQKASENYDLFFKSDFDHKQYLITKTL
tara:strand:+ start:121 stop:849 length:729 start_codon:yes stop_codon:yes gene_type:complete